MSTIARRTDPATSHQGAREITRSGHRQSLVELVTQYVHDHPGQPRARIAEAIGVSEYAISKRLSDAESRQLIRKDGSVRVWGRSQSLWWPARPAEGMQAQLFGGA